MQLSRLIFLVPLTFGCIQKKPLAETKAARSTELTFSRYVESCTEELGEIPALDCRENADGWTALVLPQYGLKENSLGDFGSSDPKPLVQDGSFHDTSEGCVNPRWITGIGKGMLCSAKQILAFRKSTNSRKETVQWRTLCRDSKFDGTSDKVLGFGQVGLIGYNETTGSTCFFNVSNPARNFSWPKPSAADASNAYDSFEKIKNSGTCVKCHSTGPWLRTPLVVPYVVAKKLRGGDFAKKVEGIYKPDIFNAPWEQFQEAAETHAVPSMFSFDHGKRTFKPYRIVEGEALEALHGANSWTPLKWTSPATSYCETCHEVSVMNAMPAYFHFLTGHPDLGPSPAVPPDPRFKNWHDLLFAKLDEKKLAPFHEALGRLRTGKTVPIEETRPLN